jgi:PAS domain S-box-containing protein
MGHSEMSVNTQLLNFINNTNSPVFITNISGEIVWINQGLTTSFGYTSAELLGELLYSWQGQIKDVLEQIVADKKNTRQELLFVDKQDRKHCVDVEVSILPAEGDKSEQILFFGHKVSPFPYQLYSSLDYRRQLETLINNYPGGAITIVDKDLHLIYPQGQGYQQAVLGLQTFKGKHLKEFAPEVVYNALQKKMPVLEDGKSFSHKVKIKNFTFNNTYQPVFDENGQLSSIIIITNNITTLHHYQKQVAKHQDKYQALFELANDAIILVNPANQQINAANQAAVQLLGYSKEEFLALERHQLFLPAIQEQTLQAWNQQLEEKEEARLDTIWVNKAGEQIQIEMLSKVITLPNEEVLMVIGKDRTDYIKIRQALEKSHTIYQSLFEHSLSGVLFANDEGRYMAVNPAACRLLGYSKEELLQLHVWDIMPNSNKEEGKLAWKHFITEDSLTGEYEVVSKDGTHRITEFQAVFNVQKGLHMSIFYDVTERKKIEKALADTTKDLRDAVQAGKVGLWGWNIQTNEVEFSHEWKAQIGYDDNDQFTTLKDFTSSIHPNERALLQAYMDKILSGDVDTIALEFRLRHKDGSYRWVSTQGAVFTDETGKRTSIKGTQIDITENKEILRALKGSENRLELALKSTGLGTWDWNLQTGEVIFNDRWAEILGYMPQEVAQNISTWEKTRVHPDDLPKVEQALSEHLEGKTDIYRAEQRLMTKQGAWKWVLDTGKVFVRDENGVPLRAVGTLLDIDEIKRNEEELKSLNHKFQLAYETASIGLWEHNYRTEKSVWDDKMYQIFGVNHQNFQTEKQSWLEELVHPDDRQRVKEEIATFFQLGITIQENDFRVITPDEKVKYLKSSAYIEYDKQGKPLYGTGLTIDLTHIKEAEEKAKQASKAKSEFLANMSHEIKTPLNGVIGFVDLLLETSLNDSQQEYLKIVHQSAYTLLDIISDILDFSKIEAGKMHISVTQTEIIPLINQVVSMVKYVAQKKKLELLLNLPENLPQFLFIDGVRFKQILTNLLSNAVKFTEKGEIELTIEVLEQLPNQETKFRFAIKDTGIGIAPENQAKVLEAFSQADASTTRKFGGTGLGLTITNKLLNLMGSQLHMKSVLNEGSTFYFDIPLKYELGNNLQVEKLVGVNKVMVVDNNEKHCELLQKILQDWGIEVSVATNGIELLQQLTDGKRYDVVLIDYQMPFMDGLQCIEKIRQDLRIPRQQQEIILLNNIANTEEVLQQCEAYGVGQSLAKPLHAQKIYQALSKLVEIQEKRRNTSKEARKILIVEDNEINAILTQSIVERIMPNAVIKEALNGAEAVKVYEEEAPDLILMDIQMPVMNGHEACREIRKIENNETHPTKIIALTANTSVGEKERCLASGMDDYMSKPIAQAMIEDLLMKWLNLS